MHSCFWVVSVSVPNEATAQLIRIHNDSVTFPVNSNNDIAAETSEKKDN